jgi:hypothetical protein
MCDLGFCHTIGFFKACNQDPSADQGSINECGRVSYSTCSGWAATQPGVGGKGGPVSWLHVKVSQYLKKWCGHFGTHCPRELDAVSPLSKDCSPFVNLSVVPPMPELCYGVLNTS